MKLFFAPNSPFARKLRIVLREADLLDRIAEEQVVLRNPDNATLAFGPTGRVPALLTDRGALLLEADIIIRFLEDKGLVNGLRPTGDEAAERDLELDGIATELMESLSWRARELRFRPLEMQFADFLDYERARCRRCYDWLEANAARLGAATTVGRIGAAVALSTADQALLADSWREGRPVLAAWFESFAARPSVADTSYPGW